MPRLEAILLAQAEVVEQSWAMTRQFLAINKVVMDDDGRPAVARVDDTRETEAYFIYFPVQGEDYHFVVVIRPDENGQLGVSSVYEQAGTRVYLAIYSLSLHPDEITNRVQITPTEKSAIGDPIGKTGSRNRQRHIWRYEPQAGLPGTVEEKLRTLLGQLEGVSPLISALRPGCDVQVTVVYDAWYGNGMIGGFLLDADIVPRLAALGAEMYFDLYAWGPPLTDDA